ncbi:protein of unknown function DUF395, YeeE/YedE (plasmid) [Nitrobacter hamburgensis X14]|uniref:Uncharacterized protein n=1 Tax=Nitrobacter hamburgensis (strain DSM 10229 / NCIMB 13809 / X14) TaxID=323097 RepID=Q1QF12_NITHX|nr:YeeE/YedE family protein [Nitrobacter hamburgensis]ABE65185.1 protein of unknown function DUF395, YeeE/YedE [Nitrobacter hamburgensis X14]
MDNFTPFSALAGGSLIGLAAALLLLLNGRIAGVSGILGGIIGAIVPEATWRVAFIAGLVLSSVVYAASGATLPRISIDHSVGALIIAGLLVGFGTRLGSGCTSGHGVCGMARGSRRSLVATAVFMGTSILTVFVARHVIGG